MSPVFRQIMAKSILSKSGIEGITYCVNPYVGCSHGCRYCYAAFMKRFSGHHEPWGDFVDAKINAASVLEKQLVKAARGVVLISSVTDPYQPVERELGLTRSCIEVLRQRDFPMHVLTKSPLVLRDVDLLSGFSESEVGVTLTTDDDKIRHLFEPHAPPIPDRVLALKRLYEAGIRTYAFFGPILPMEPERLVDMVAPYVDSVLIDRMNYRWKTVTLYRQHGLLSWLDGDHLADIEERLFKALSGKGRIV
jgi:DNA repair photolyase